MSRVKVTLLSQVLGLIDRDIFKQIVNRHEGDKHAKGVDSWTHLVCMLFMQMGDLSSLRDISTGVRSATGNLSHLGVHKAPCKSSLSYRNKHRSYKIFEDLYYALLAKLKPGDPKARSYARRLKRKIFLLDASIIPLSLSLFDWAKYRTHKGAVKLHTVLDYDSGLPNYAVLSDGKTNDLKAARKMSFSPGSVLVMDRAYVDFEWLNDLDSNKVFFVTRLKKNADIQIAEEYLTNDKHEHVLSDQDIEMAGFYTAKKYPNKLRIVKVYDQANDQHLILLTNQLSWTADTISQLYKARWDVEVFFKHLKQLFRVNPLLELQRML